MADGARADAAPRLVVISPGPLHGTLLPLGGTELLVGRHEAVDLRLDDPHVSRFHARLRRAGADMTIQDLGSSGGTTVNGAPIAGPAVLHDGDRICFASIEALYEQTAGGGTANVSIAVAPPVAASDPAPGTAPRVTYAVERQQGEQINNVAGDQYFAQLQEQRSAFFEELATFKSRGRRLLVFGFVLVVVGFGVYLSVILRFISSVSESFGSDSADPEAARQLGANLFGPSVGGVPLGLIGFGVASLGTVLMIVGIVFHIVAAARRRAFERQLSNSRPQGGWAPGWPTRPPNYS
jgi:hypothetical protein